MHKDMPALLRPRERVPALLARLRHAAACAYMFHPVPCVCLRKDVHVLLRPRERVPALLARLRLGHGAVAVDSTPRRLAVSVAAVAARQPDVEELVRGPPAKVCHPTLCRAEGLSVQRIYKPCLRVMWKRSCASPPPRVSHPSQERRQDLK